ncbi:PREDICTED: carboxypeptidase B-like [Ceratosolen solmsi marchali]|uniref:Carboxypeptidase B-like n=1 Tax=Ceratosolen solmsi marchali TaxID=326594 RepID=A0AAJ6YVU8_9HYME|nr:PREDICTED: carboxypeptidase B-like [Ceratosolen solmsi marchali]
MKVHLIILLFFSLCIWTQDAAYLPSIYGMQGLRISCDTELQLKYVRNYEGSLGFDFIKIPRVLQKPIEVLVVAEKLQLFKNNLIANGINYEVFLEDVGAHIDKQFALEYDERIVNPKNEILKTFPLYNEITLYLESLQNSHSDILQTFTIGKSFENRDIIGVKISSGGSGKPALFIDAGIHAREWIAPTTAIYAIKQLAENASNSYIFDNIDIYIVPCLNPDGYEFTHRNSANRMWRKTRSTKKFSPCVGVDANRNFDFEWMTVGASSNPCSETYAGVTAFSEPETSALRDFLLSKNNTIKVYITFHSYGNFLLHPWGYTEELPTNEPTLRCVADKAENKLSQKRGTHYEIGSSTNVLYAAAGGSDDWAMGVAGIELAYTMELPSQRYGFAAPRSEIIPVGQETFEAIKIFAKYVEGVKCQDL